MLARAWANRKMRTYSHGLATVATRFHQAKKKDDEAATPKGFNHVGLLVS